MAIVSPTIAEFEPTHDFLTCFICKEFLYEPQVLSCGHSLCFLCTDSLKSIDNKKDNISCPLCKKTTLTSNISTNFVLRDLLQSQYKSQYNNPEKLAKYEARHLVEKLNKFKYENNIIVSGTGKELEPERLLKILTFLEQNYKKFNEKNSSAKEIQNYLIDNEVFIYYKEYVTVETVISIDRMLYYWCISKKDCYSIDILKLKIPQK